MLAFYHGIATRLYGLRLLLWLLCALALGAFAGALALGDGRGDPVLMLASVTLLMWMLCVIVVTYSFAGPLPTAGPEARLWQRLRASLKRGVLWLVAILMSVLTGLVLFASLRAAGLLVRALGTHAG